MHRIVAPLVATLALSYLVLAAEPPATDRRHPAGPLLVRPEDHEGLQSGGNAEENNP